MLRDRFRVGTFALRIMDNLAHMGAASGIVEDVVVQLKLVRKRNWQTDDGVCNPVLQRNDLLQVFTLQYLKRKVAHRFYEFLGFRKQGYSFIVDFAGGGERSSRDACWHLVELYRYA